jgi:hypothetical protein
VFVVAVATGEEVYEAVLDVIRQLHAQVYEQDEMDGIQDPYRAVDQSDLLVWINGAAPPKGDVVFGPTDYNYLYGDTVLQRAVRSGKPVLYYARDRPTGFPSPALLRRLARRQRFQSIEQLEEQLRQDFADLRSGRIAGGIAGSADAGAGNRRRECDSHAVRACDLASDAGAPGICRLHRRPRAGLRSCVGSNGPVARVEAGRTRSHVRLQ